MKVYWFFIALTLVICIMDGFSYQIVKCGNRYEKRAGWIQAILMFGILIFFCGLRSGVADTSTYIQMFHNFPDSIGAVEWSEDIKDKGFYALSVLYKQFISADFHGWLFLIAFVSGFAMMITLKKYSCSFGFSCFLFIASTLFTYMVNGIRQFLCVAIFFCCTDLILKKKFIPYLAVILFLSTIHGSAIFLLLVYFIANTPAWSGRMCLIILLAMGMGVYFDKLFPVLGGILEETQYGNYVDYISSSGVGSSVLRLFIAGIPCMMSYIGQKQFHYRDHPLINMAINMSVLNFCIYFIATFSSGMAIGRLTIYFDVYNLLLLPWIIKEGFDQKNARIVFTLCVLFYLVFFYIQMVLTWGMVYESDLLNLYC